MLEYDRIDVSERIVNKTDVSREFIFCNYYYFLKVNIIFQPKSRRMYGRWIITILIIERKKRLLEQAKTA